MTTLPIPPPISNWHSCNTSTATSKWVDGLLWCFRYNVLFGRQHWTRHPHRPDEQVQPAHHLAPPMASSTHKGSRPTCSSLNRGLHRHQQHQGCVGLRFADQHAQFREAFSLHDEPPPTLHRCLWRGSGRQQYPNRRGRRRALPKSSADRPSPTRTTTSTYPWLRDDGVERAEDLQSLMR